VLVDEGYDHTPHCRSKRYLCRHRLESSNGFSVLDVLTIFFFLNRIMTKQSKELLSFSFNKLVSKMYPVSHHCDEDLQRANIFLGCIE